MMPNAPISSACFTMKLIISAPFCGTRTRGVTAIWRCPLAAILCLSVMPSRKIRSVSGLHGPCSMSMMMKSRPDLESARALVRDQSPLMMPNTASWPSSSSITRLRRVSCASSGAGARRTGPARTVQTATAAAERRDGMSSISWRRSRARCRWVSGTSPTSGARLSSGARCSSDLGCHAPCLRR